MTPSDVVFLLDVDNTLLDNDRIIADLGRHLSQAFGSERAIRYWAIFEEMRADLGYADYLGALQRYRIENPRDPNFLELSHYLITYPFANRIFPGAVDVVEHFGQWGPTVILSDGGCRLSATQGRTLRPVRSRPGARAHLYPQGARARRRHSALPGASLRHGR